LRPDQLAAEADYVIPEEPGAVLITPGPEQVGDLLHAARETAWGTADVLGVPLAEFRRRARDRALALAAAYTRRFDASGNAGAAVGGTAGSLTAGRPVILMGHQPLFFHPGVWMKFFLLTRLAVEHAAIGLHVIVDTDATGPVTADVPADGGRLVRVSETLVEVPDATPLEAVPPPAPRAWQGFVERVKAHLATLPSPEYVEHCSRYAAGEEHVRPRAETLAEFLAGLRRAYEARIGPPGYLELPMSRLADTPEFRAFALHLLRSPDTLHRAYNTSLDDYRRLHRVRSAANPFPNLRQGDGRVETPFWVMHGGKRTELFVGRHGANLVLATAGEDVASVPADAGGIDALAAAGVVLRPKAMMLTLFLRLCLGELCIHGVSGGRYDRVTDMIGERLFGRRPPAYVVATATLYPRLLAEAHIAEQRRALERRVMDLRHNPDRHLVAPSDDQRRLVDEKWTLIRAVETMRPGSDRRAASRRIREVNEQLAEALSSEISTLEARLAALQTAQVAEAAARHRGYAFFLFDPAEVRALAAGGGS
jgi:hypothetical protein